MTDENIVPLFGGAQENLPSTRRLAQERGSTRYFTGKPCHKGHIAPRFTASGTCLVCGAEAQRALWTAGHRPDPEARARAWQKYNQTEAAKQSKWNWVQKDPRRAWAHSVTSTAKRRAKEKGVPFDLTPDYVRSLAVDRCPSLGVELVYGSGNGGSAEYNSASLDRIVPSLGYVRGNVQVLSARANAMKSDASPEELLLFANWVLRTPLKAAA
jgi:hypothetical protein